MQSTLPIPRPLRHLVLVLGDQLDEHAAAFDGFSSNCDAVWMAEVAEESTHIWSSKQRTALFLTAMRHFALRLHELARPLLYTRLDDTDNLGSLAAVLRRTLQTHKPQALIVTEPGDLRVRTALEQVAKDCQVPIQVRTDRHFYSTASEFAAHAAGRKQLRLEFFYRELRQKTGILMDGKKPLGGQWNYDEDNRESFGHKGPGLVPPPTRFAPDEITQQVIALVNARFASHPGTLDDFAWPVTRAQAHKALAEFVTHRLPDFGRYQDAMWEGQAWLYHSHLSAAMNLKLLDPREVIDAALAAYAAGRVPLSATEGFVRQILGWREYVRGVYFTQMPDYLHKNELGAHEPLPAFYWTGDTDMACLRDVIRQTLRFGYAHHIQRLMVTGLYALLLGVTPQHVHEWYLSVYVDAVEWVELPNTLGMSQFADGGLLGSKPYAASGKYIQRMSNHCQGCRYDPAVSVGPTACPFTTLYWDFLLRHESRLSKNPRMVMQVKNLTRLSPEQQAAIRDQAARLRSASQPDASSAAVPG